MGTTKKQAKPSAGGQKSDFKGIDGLTRTVEAHLHKRGILTLADLAQCAPSRLRKLLGELPTLPAMQILSQCWVRQAENLTRDPQPPNRPARTAPVEQPKASKPMRDISFVVDLYLDEQQRVRRTHMLEVKNSVDEAWDGWDAERLLQFISEGAGVTLASVPALPALAKASAAAANHSLPAEDSRESFDPVRYEIPPSTGLLEAFVSNVQQPVSQTTSGQVCKVQVSVDRAALQLHPSQELDYEAEIFARSLEHKPNIRLAGAHGTLRSDSRITVNLPVDSVAAGLYKLEAVLRLKCSEANNSRRNSTETVTTLIRGGMFRVY